MGHNQSITDKYSLQQEEVYTTSPTVAINTTGTMTAPTVQLLVSLRFIQLQVLLPQSRSIHRPITSWDREQLVSDTPSPSISFSGSPSPVQPTYNSHNICRLVQSQLSIGNSGFGYQSTPTVSISVQNWCHYTVYNCNWYYGNNQI